MKKLQINGAVVSNDYGMMYDFFGMDYTSPAKVQDFLNESDTEDIEIVINSGGGDVFAGSEIYSMLKDYSGNVDVKVYGIAASSASVIAMGGTTIKMSPTAQIMIHNVSSGANGDYRDMDKMSEILKNCNESLANSYVQKTGKTKEEILKMMNSETWLSADKAIEQGFADEMLFVSEEEPVLSNDLNNVVSPESLNKFLNLINKTKDEEDDKEESGDKDTSKSEEENDKNKPEKDKEESTSSDDEDDDKKKDNLSNSLTILKLKGKIYE
ncbi:head maturation protease, ClpP-related [Companilactobacillus metriopterae]|uniref:head maturation protease, ClpP-related n=1 Tax=Companilactobacillus metriopterae TaxID=1909267 RepID=UPI00100A6501|nr:head maturation protease, ClpP-related [Companilactobacillus metriopterae]